jgi:hypothetical protein
MIPRSLEVNQNIRKEWVPAADWTILSGLPQGVRRDDDAPRRDAWVQ